MSIFTGTLLEYFEEEITLIDEISVDDGFGSFKPEWIDGAKITVAIIQPRDTKTVIANAISGKQSITIITGTDVELKQDKYFRRESDGKTYKIDYDNMEKLAPKNSKLQWRKTTATGAALPKKRYEQASGNQ